MTAPERAAAPGQGAGGQAIVCDDATSYLRLGREVLHRLAWRAWADRDSLPVSPELDDALTLVEPEDFSPDLVALARVLLSDLEPLMRALMPPSVSRRDYRRVAAVLADAEPTPDRLLPGALVVLARNGAQRRLQRAAADLAHAAVGTATEHRQRLLEAVERAAARVAAIEGGAV